VCCRFESEPREVRSTRLLSCLDEFIRRRCRLDNNDNNMASLSASACFQSVDRDLLTSLAGHVTRDNVTSGDET